MLAARRDLQNFALAGEGFRGPNSCPARARAAVGADAAPCRPIDGIANSLHISRAEFIRSLIDKAVVEWKKQQEIAGMLKAFEAMKHDSAYQKEADEIMDGLNSELPEEEDEWWTKK